MEHDGNCYCVPMPFRDAHVAHGDPYGYALFILPRRRIAWKFGSKKG